MKTTFTIYSKKTCSKLKGFWDFFFFIMLVFEYICRTSLSDFFVKYGSIRVLPVIFSCIQRIIAPEVFCKSSAVKNFAKFTGKHMCQSTFFNKLAKWACNFIKKVTPAQVLYCKFCEVFENTYFEEHRRTAVLNVHMFITYRRIYWNRIAVTMDIGRQGKLR